MTTSDPIARSFGKAKEHGRILGRRWLFGSLFLGAGLGLVLLDGLRRGVIAQGANRESTSVAVHAGALVAPVVLESARQPVALGAAADEDLRASPPELGKGAPTRAYLADYYGARWPEVEAKMQAWAASSLHDLDLDMPYYQRPWEEVEGDFVASLPMKEAARASLIRSRMRWPETLTESYIREEFPPTRGRRYELDESDLPVIAMLVEPKNEEAARLALTFTERIDAHLLDRWATGGYLRAPFTTGGMSDKMGFHSMSTGGHGWAITITLTREECPDVVEVEHQLEAVTEERDQIVRDYLAAKIVR